MTRTELRLLAEVSRGLVVVDQRGASRDSIGWRVTARLSALEAAGLVVLAGGKWRLTPAGLAVIRARKGAKS